MFQSTGLVRLLVGAAVTIGVFAPQPAVAQSSDSWKGTIAPFYLWATRINGDIATRAGTLPVFMTFDDAEHNLAGAFSFHFEAEKSRFGIFSDLDFVRLSTASAFTLQGPLAQTVSGDADVNNTFFEAGGSYLLSDKMPFAVIAGLRTYTLATNVEFTTPNVSVTPIDANRTAVSGFAGFTFRPVITDKLSFLSRADIGGGSGKSWSGVLEWNSGRSHGLAWSSDTRAWESISGRTPMTRTFER